MRKTIKISLFLLFGLCCMIKGYTQALPELKKSPDGLLYHIYKTSKDTLRPVTGNWISFDMRYVSKVHGKDTVLFDSKKQMKGQPVLMELPPSDFKGDLYEGIGMLSAGDSGLFVVSPDSLFIKTFRMKSRPPILDSTAMIYFYACLHSFTTMEKLKEDEQTNLRRYITDNKITVAPTANGVYIVESVKGEGAKIDSGSMVTLQFTVSLIDGRQIFSSYDRPEPLKFQFGKKFDTPGLDEGIKILRKGSKARIIVPSKMAFGDKGRGVVVTPFSTLVYDVEILNVQTKEEYETEKKLELQKMEEKKEAIRKDENAVLEKYVKDNNITTPPTASGLYYIEKVKGTGEQAVAGKKVKVHYTGTLLNGTKFDSSVDRGEPFSFTLGAGQVIKGWDEGIALMKVGGKATLLIPSKIGYGERDMGTIPPYSTLVFDVELLGVEEAK